jgi:hypothetical protein
MCASVPRQTRAHNFHQTTFLERLVWKQRPTRSGIVVRLHNARIVPAPLLEPTPSNTELVRAPCCEVEERVRRMCMRTQSCTPPRSYSLPPPDIFNASMPQRITAHALMHRTATEGRIPRGNKMLQTLKQTCFQVEARKRNMRSKVY